MDTTTLRDLLRFARDIPAAYAQAPPDLQKYYLRVFFKELRVRDKTIVKVVLADFFHTLFEGKLVRSEPNWLRIVDDVRTIFQHTKEYVYVPSLAPQA